MIWWKVLLVMSPFAVLIWMTGREFMEEPDEKDRPIRRPFMAWWITFCAVLIGTVAILGVF